MRYCILLCILFNSCTKKFIQKPQENQDLVSLDNENNVLYITNELQKHDIQGPLFWFSIILITVMLLTYSCSMFKNE
ncbi:MAG: hypothetical protein CL833_01025 [Crocinitomicaceae bacterium]|nr:hypothetical protein [Crocinitomicaceae bacterium]